MYPSRFEYVVPESVADAVSVLAQHGDEAKVLAGGQSLIPLMKLRFAAPGLLVDVNPIVRNLGTVCGSVAHADPQGDWGSALIAANARVVAVGPSGSREIALSEL